MLKSAMPVLCRALVPEAPPAGDAGSPRGAGGAARAAARSRPAVPAALGPARGRGVPRWPRPWTARCPPAWRPDRGELVREAVPCRWNDEEIARLRGFLRAVDDLRGRQGRVYPLEYLLALPLIAGMAGDGELDAAAEWLRQRRRNC